MYFQMIDCGEDHGPCIGMGFYGSNVLSPPSVKKSKQFSLSELNCFQSSKDEFHLIKSGEEQGKKSLLKL